MESGELVVQFLLFVELRQLRAGLLKLILVIIDEESLRDRLIVTRRHLIVLRCALSAYLEGNPFGDKHEGVVDRNRIAVGADLTAHHETRMLLHIGQHSVERGAAHIVPVDINTCGTGTVVCVV